MKIIENDSAKKEWNDIEKISGIYKIINKIDGKYYVGRSKNIKHRWDVHLKQLCSNCHPNDHLQNAWNKYKQNAFDFIIIEQTLPNNLEKIEQSYLNIAETEQEKCYNLCFDANHGKLSYYARQKISKAHKGKVFTEEHKKKISDAHKGKPKHALSPETKKKMSEAHKGKHTGKSNPMYGKSISEDTRQKLIESHIGSKNHNYGKPRDESVRIKISNKLKEKYKNGFKVTRTPESISKVSGINNTASDKTIYTFTNIITKETYVGYRIEFLKKYNLNACCLSDVIKGKSKHTKNWVLIKNQADFVSQPDS